MIPAKAFNWLTVLDELVHAADLGSRVMTTTVINWEQRGCGARSDMYTHWRLCRRSTWKPYLFPKLVAA